SRRRRLHARPRRRAAPRGRTSGSTTGFRPRRATGASPRRPQDRGASSRGGRRRWESSFASRARPYEGRLTPRVHGVFFRLLTRESRSACALATLFLGPVILKKTDPFGPTAMAPDSAQPFLDDVGPPMPEPAAYVPSAVT